jgi:hypothetical protein
MLVFRSAEGRFASTEHPGTCEGLFAKKLRLEPGASRSTTLDARVRRATKEERGPKRGEGTLIVHTDDYRVLLDAPGRHEVFARWTDRQGRSVSKPVAVEIASPR